MLYKFSFLVIVLLFVGQLSMAQCASSLDIVQSYSEEQGGQLEVLVQTQGSFEFTLLEYSNGQYEEIQKGEALNGEDLTFNLLKKDTIYKVKVLFHREKGLCRVRQRGGITF